MAGKICGILLDVEIALFGCVFAVYSILLAFLSDEYVKKLLEIDYYRQTNYLRKSTKYYEAALFIYFVAIGISLVYKLTIECMPQNFALIVSELDAGKKITSLNSRIRGLRVFFKFCAERE